MRPVEATEMRVFISHVTEDFELARDLAVRLEEERISAWYYERDALPGPDYLREIGKAVEESLAFVLLASSKSLTSSDVTNEIVRACETRRPIFPILIDIDHAEIQERQPVWIQALGSAPSISLRDLGMSEAFSKILAEVRALSPDPPPCQRIVGLSTSDSPRRTR
jgi:hypothetical protein